MDENEKGISWYIKWLWGWYCSLSQTHDDITWWIMTIPDELICALCTFIWFEYFRSSDTVQQLLICHLTVLAQCSSTRDSAEQGHLVTQHSGLGWSISPIGPLCSDSQGLWSMEATKQCFSHLILQMNKTSPANNKMGTRLFSVFAPAKSGWCYYGPYHHPDHPEIDDNQSHMITVLCDWLSYIFGPWNHDKNCESTSSSGPAGHKVGRWCGPAAY